MGKSVTRARREPFKLTRLLLACLLSAFGVGAARAQQAPQDDTQSWNELLFTVPIKPWVELTATGQLRFGRNITDFVDERGGFGFNFKVGPYLTLSPSLLHVATQPVDGRKNFENRLVLAASVKSKKFGDFKGGNFALSHRSQFERRYRDPANSTRYRNRVQLEYEKKDTPDAKDARKLHLFVSDEVFYDWAVDEWVRNRFQIGGGRTFGAHDGMFRFDLYYMRQNDGRARPGDLHVIGTTLRVTFKASKKKPPTVEVTP